MASRYMLKSGLLPNNSPPTKGKGKGRGKGKGKKGLKKLADTQEKDNVLLQQIRNSQLVYTPYAATLIGANLTLTENGLPPTQNAATTPLYLPSSFPAEIHSQPDMKSICEKECRLREAQADDALFDLRRQRCVMQGLWQFKKLNMSGTSNRPNTRMLTLHKQMQQKVMRIADRYRRARAALVVLDPEGDWCTCLKELKNEDIRGPGKEAHEGTTNSRYEPSWIWLVPRAMASNNQSDMTEFNDSMRVEWAKTRARAMRWKEEYVLVQEEMRHVLAWHNYKANEWESQVDQRTSGDRSILQGVSAYAHKQAHIAHRMAA